MLPRQKRIFFCMQYGQLRRENTRKTKNITLSDSFSNQDLEVNLVASQPLSKLRQPIELLAKNLEQFKQEKVEDNSSENEIVKLQWRPIKMRIFH